MKKIFLIILPLLIGFLAQAQENKLSILPTIGVSSPILDDGIGFHIGVNPSYALSQHFSIEGQMSYVFTRINGSFLSGKTGTANAVNTLLGLRVYLNGEDNKTRLYVNLLAGGNYEQETKDGVSEEAEFDLGFSVGGFIEFNKIVAGLSLDTPQNFILKLGYRFR